MKMKMKKKPELTARERKQAIVYALNLMEILKSVTQGGETVEDRKFSKAVQRLKSELINWEFNF